MNGESRSQPSSTKGPHSSNPGWRPCMTSRVRAGHRIIMLLTLWKFHIAGDIHHFSRQVRAIHETQWAMSNSTAMSNYQGTFTENSPIFCSMIFRLKDTETWMVPWPHKKSNADDDGVPFIAGKVEEQTWTNYLSLRLGMTFFVWGFPYGWWCIPHSTLLGFA